MAAMPPEAAGWVKARSQIFLNQLNLNMKMESSKENLSHPLTQEAGLHLTAQAAV